MGVFDVRPKPLSINQIDTIVRDYLKQRNDIKLDLDSVETEILAGTPQWTLIQVIENYLLAVFNPKYYKFFLQMDKQIGNGVLPKKPSGSFDFCLAFFQFSIAIRNLPTDAQVEIMEMGSLAFASFDSRLDTIRSYVDVLTKIYIPQLQRYELTSVEGVEDGRFEELIKHNLKDNNNLLNYYLSQRPDMAKLLTKKTKLVN